VPDTDVLESTENIPAVEVMLVDNIITEFYLIDIIQGILEKWE
jgi:hypothetical protein